MNITSINKTFDPNNRLIEALELILQDARNGIVRSMVCITERFDGRIGQIIETSATTDGLQILGALSVLNHTLSKSMIPSR